MKCWEIIADNLSKTGISAVSQLRIKRGDNFGLPLAERDGAGRFIVQVDEKLTAFIQLERAVCIHLLSEQC